MAAKILLVEDDQVTQDLLTHLIKARGHVVMGVGDGTAAVSAAMEHVPDLILCDINLPTANGLEVLQRLKASAITKRIPVVALTASGAKSDAAASTVRDRIVGMGFDGYIPKPVDPTTFARQVEGFLPSKAES